MFSKSVTSFAVDTKHRPHQYETPAQTSEIARKLLASSIRCVPWKDVYKFVSPGDMNRIIRRIKPMDLGDLNAPDASFYSDLRDRIVHNRDINDEGLLDSFEDHVFPKLSPLYDQSNADKQTRKDALVLFLCKAANGDVRSLVNTIWPNFEERNEKERVYNAIQSFGSLVDSDDDKQEVAREIGFLIRNLHFPEIDDGSIFLVEPVKYEERAINRNPSSAPPPLEMPEPEWNDSMDIDCRKLDDNIKLKEWKEKHAIDARFSSKNSAKQLLTMYYAPECKHSLKDYLGKYQTCEDLLDCNDFDISDSEVNDLWTQLIVESDDITPLMETPQMNEFVDSHVKDRSQLTQKKALLNFIHRGENIDASFIGTMLELT